jgi:exodeoxyribonuclease-5
MKCRAQGGEWAKVLLIDESGAFGHEARRWLYTGITRASLELTIIVGR